MGLKKFPRPPAVTPKPGESVHEAVERTILEKQTAQAKTLNDPFLDLWSSLAKGFQDTVTVSPPVTYEKALKAQAKYLSLAAGVQYSGLILGTLAEAGSLGIIRTPQKIIDSLYWLFGLGFLGWQLMAPAMRYSILEPLEEYYKRYYRPKQLTESEARDAFELGLRDEKWYVEYLRKQGYSEELIELKVQVARLKALERQGIRVLREKEVPRSEAEEAYLNNDITEEELAKIYANLGYKDSAIEIMLRNMKRKKEARK